MSETILTEIIETEKEAVRIEEESSRQVREMVADARKNTADINEKCISDSESVRADILQRTRMEAQNEIERHEESVVKSADELKQHAKQHLDEAVEFILGRIVDLSGSR